MAGKKKQKDAVTGVLNAGSKLVSACAALLAIVMILYSGYVLYDSMAIEMSAFSANSDLLKYKPSALAQPSGEEQPSLADINPDYRGWITVEGDPASPIDYPVVQGTDDLYYAFHDVYGDSRLSGSIYLAAANSPDLSDSYNLIYGHHMDNGAMFGSLDKFRDRDYFNKHRTVTVTASDGTVYEVYLFAVFSTDAYEDKIYTAGDRMQDVLDFLNGSRNNDAGRGTQLIIYDRMGTTGAKQILALSTCAGAETAGRLVVLGSMMKLTEPDPTDKPTRRPGVVTPTPSPTPAEIVKLTVKFHEDYSPVFPDQIIYYTPGSGYYVVPPQYPGYDVDIQIVRGTIEEDMIVVVHYIPKAWTLSIRYIYPDGTEAAAPYEAVVRTDAAYDVESPVIEGYKALTLRVSGTNPGRNEQYTVIYVPEDAEPGDPPAPLGLETTSMQAGVCFE